MENSNIICNKCNAKIKPSSNFCTECGKPVDEPHAENGKVVELDKKNYQLLS